MSLRKTALELDIIFKSDHNIIKKNKIHPFVVQLVYELHEDNFDFRDESFMI